MGQLQALNACQPPKRFTLPGKLEEITCPLITQVWEQELKGYPDKQFAQYILAGIKNGFRIGFNYTAVKLTDSSNNMLSAIEHPEVVDEYLDAELEHQRMCRVPPENLNTIQCHFKSIWSDPEEIQTE